MQNGGVGKSKALEEKREARMGAGGGREGGCVCVCVRERKRERDILSRLFHAWTKTNHTKSWASRVAVQWLVCNGYSKPVHTLLLSLKCYPLMIF